MITLYTVFYTHGVPFYGCWWSHVEIHSEFFILLGTLLGLSVALTLVVNNSNPIHFTPNLLSPFLFLCFYVFLLKFLPFRQNITLFFFNFFRKRLLATCFHSVNSLQLSLAEILSFFDTVLNTLRFQPKSKRCSNQAKMTMRTIKNRQPKDFSIKIKTTENHPTFPDGSRCFLGLSIKSDLFCLNNDC